MIEQRDPGDEDDYRSPLKRGWQFIGIEVDSVEAYRRAGDMARIRGGECHVFSEDDGYEVRWRPSVTKGGH